MRQPEDNKAVRRRGGFTAVELAVVAGIVGVLAGAAALSYFRWLPSYRLQNAAAELDCALRQARMQAISHGRPVRAIFDLPGKRCAIWEDLNTNGVADSGEQTLCVLDDKPDCTLQANMTQGVFNARGAFEASSAAYLSITVTVSGAGARYLHVLPSGHSARMNRSP
jgi:Tfp pilus assembly protein FimT